MTTIATDAFFAALDDCAKQVTSHLLRDKYLNRFQPNDMREAVTLYVRAGGKRLRPAILSWSCGAVGGDPQSAIPAAAAVELFHTWTLVHDDIIDRDDQRRGEDTVHARFAKAMRKRHPELTPEEQYHYGVSVAVLAGDVQNGWATSLMTELTSERGIDPAVTLYLIERMDNQILNLLVEGELLDVQFCYETFDSVSEEKIEDMLWKKTGVLYSFCAIAGSIIGLGKADPSHQYVTALSEFCKRCGIAFQLQDDILGIIGDQKKLGKPIGSDIREGKHTTIVHNAFEQATEEEKHFLRNTLGKHNASDDDVHKVVSIFDRYGSIGRTRERARELMESSLPLLEILPESRYKKLLYAWADFMINRSM